MFFPGRLTARGFRDFSLPALLLWWPRFWVPGQLFPVLRLDGSRGRPHLGFAAFPLPPHLLPELFEAQLLFSLLPRGFRWRKKPLLHSAQAWLRRGKAETGTRWGTSSGWRGSPAEEIRLTSPQPFEIRPPPASPCYSFPG